MPGAVPVPASLPVPAARTAEAAEFASALVFTVLAFGQLIDGCRGCC